MIQLDLKSLLSFLSFLFHLSDFCPVLVLAMIFISCFVSLLVYYQMLNVNIFLLFVNSSHNILFIQKTPKQNKLALLSNPLRSLVRD